MKILSKLFCCFRESEKDKEEKYNKIRLKRIQLLPNYNKVCREILKDNNNKNIDTNKY